MAHSDATRAKIAKARLGKAHLKRTVTRAPTLGSPEGVRAAWWREQTMGLSRPALAEKLGIKSPITIARYEAMAVVPADYKLACAALTVGLEFDWYTAKAKVGESTITF